MARADVDEGIVDGVGGSRKRKLALTIVGADLKLTALTLLKWVYDIGQLSRWSHWQARHGEKDEC